MGTAESLQELDTIFDSPQNYSRYKTLVFKCVDEQDIPAIQKTIDKIVSTLKGSYSPLKTKSLAIDLARELVTTGSYTYFILLSSRVLPLLTQYAQFKRELSSEERSMLLVAGNVRLPGETAGQGVGTNFLSLVLQTIRAVATWLPCSPYQTMTFMSLFRLEYDSLLRDHTVFPNRPKFVQEAEWTRCNQSYKLKLSRRNQYTEHLAKYLRPRFDQYLYRGEPTENRRLAMNILWTGDNFFCGYIVQMCANTIADMTAPQAMRMRALDFLQDCFGIGDIQLMEQIKDRAVPCMTQYVLPIDFRHRRYLRKSKYTNSNIRNYCRFLLSLWSSRMRLYPFLNRNIYQLVDQKLASESVLPDPSKHQRHTDITSIMQTNVRYRKPINDVKLQNCLRLRDLDVYEDMVRKYQKGSNVETVNTVVITQEQLRPVVQVMAVPQQMSGIKGVMTTTSVMGNSRLVMGNSRLIMGQQPNIQKTSRILLPRPSKLQEISVPPPRAQSQPPQQPNLVMGAQPLSPQSQFQIRPQPVPNSQRQSQMRLQLPQPTSRSSHLQPNQNSRIIMGNPPSTIPTFPQPPPPPPPASSVSALNSNSTPTRILPQFPQSPQQSPITDPKYTSNVQHPTELPTFSAIPAQKSSKTFNEVVVQTETEGLGSRGHFGGGQGKNQVVVPTFSNLPNHQLEKSIENIISVPQFEQHISIKTLQNEVLQQSQPIKPSVNHARLSQEQSFRPKSAQPTVSEPKRDSLQTKQGEQRRQSVEQNGYGSLQNFSLSLVSRQHGSSKPLPSPNQKKLKELDQTLKIIKNGRTSQGSIIIDEDWKQNSEQFSHFHKLEQLSSKVLFDDSYNSRPQAQPSISQVEAEYSMMEESEQEEIDTSKVYQSVNKPMFKFNELGAMMRSPQLPRAVIDPISSIDKVRTSLFSSAAPFGPGSASLQKSRRSRQRLQLISVQRQQPSNLYGIPPKPTISSPVFSSYHLSPELMEFYETKIRTLEKELQARVLKQSEYEEEIQKLNEVVRLAREVTFNADSPEIYKTRIKGFSMSKRDSQSQDNIINSMNRPVNFNESRSKKLLMNRQDSLLKRDYMEVRYEWLQHTDATTLRLFYMFSQYPAEDVYAFLDSGDVFLHQSPQMRGTEVAAGKEFKQQVTMTLPRVQKFKKPVLNISYKQHGETVKTYVQLPCTLFRFVFTEPIQPQSFKKIFQNRTVKYTKDISYSPQLLRNPQLLKDLIPDLTLIEPHPHNDYQIGSSQTTYGVKISLNQQSILLKLIFSGGNRLRIEIVTKKGSNKLAEAYLDELINILQAD